MFLTTPRIVQSSWPLFIDSRSQKTYLRQGTLNYLCEYINQNPAQFLHNWSGAGYNHYSNFPTKASFKVLTNWLRNMLTMPESITYCIMHWSDHPAERYSVVLRLQYGDGLQSLGGSLVVNHSALTSPGLLIEQISSAALRKAQYVHLHRLSASLNVTHTGMVRRKKT